MKVKHALGDSSQSAESERSCVHDLPSILASLSVTVKKAFLCHSWNVRDAAIELLKKMLEIRAGLYFHTVMHVRIFNV